MTKTKQDTPRIGRPPGTFRTDRHAVLPAVRCTEEQRETWEAVGGAEWVRAMLDREAKKLARA